MRPINSNKNKLKTLINFNSHHFPDTLNKLQVSQQKKNVSYKIMFSQKKNYYYFLNLKATK